MQATAYRGAGIVVVAMPDIIGVCNRDELMQ